MQTNSYQFHYSSDEGDFPSPYAVEKSLNMSLRVSDEQTWIPVMKEFANFMSSIYGYDIGSRIMIQEQDGEVNSLDSYDMC